MSRRKKAKTNGGGAPSIYEGKAVYIATPMIDGRPFELFTESIWGARQDLAAHGIVHNYSTVCGDSLVTRARNVLVGHFLQSAGFTHLMFIDCDIQFNPASIRLLLEDDLDVVAGIYPKKCDNEEYVLNLPTRGESDWLRGCCVELRDVGTGFLMVKREVFERMIAENAVEKIDRPVPSPVSEGLWPEFRKYYWNFFGERVIDGEHLSEDYAFCRIWSQMGGKCFADVRVNLNHVGQKVYQGRVWPYMQKMMEVKEPEKCPTPDKDSPQTTPTLPPPPAASAGARRRPQATPPTPPQT